MADTNPHLRQLALFDRAATAKDLGVLLVLDEHGDSLYDAGAVSARRLNNADRDYFQAHKARPDLGLVISGPLVSKLLGAPAIVLSRRVNKPDGSFGGIVLGTLQLSYFKHLFAQIGLGPEGAINLYHRSGQRLARYPAVAGDIGANLAGTVNFERFVREGRGTFINTSVRDGIERHYAFTQVGELPLVLNVAFSTREIEAAWRTKAAVITGIVIALCGMTAGLGLLFGRELRRRAAVEAELERMAWTDGLTGLPNRRRFEQTLEMEWGRRRRQRGDELSLLVIDVDHFKRFNDRFGHQLGDRVLVEIAEALMTSVTRPDDVIARVGGEEFLVILPRTNEDAAAEVAARIHRAVARIALDAASGPVGRITVSIGLASASTRSTPPASAPDLYSLADRALYEAKAQGRNRTQRAPIVSHSPIEAASVALAA